jgi:hypothetical protein
MVNILVGHQNIDTQVGDDTNIGISIEANGGSHNKSSRARKTTSTITERIKGTTRVDE